MILIDSNLLLYATLKELSHHTRAKVWLEGVMNGHQPIALSWTVLLAVLRISTHPRVLKRPLTVEQALGLIDGWLDHPLVQLIEPGPAHWGILRTLSAEAGTAGNLSTDAHLAALAIEHGCTLHSADNDFRRFPGLRFRDPLR
ncbi:MAG: type II toxin-antitoxin system VapC family toxin [Synechococcaceae cyanobacterium]|nr:type II toxin-antitoxin system VapC family toxin [Synechococcaceae cyanobacterium]